MSGMFSGATAMLANYPNLPRDGDIDPNNWSRYFPKLLRKPTKSARSTDPNRPAGPGEGGQ
jgi:hypothetical protein